jgi:hypothetical protein
MRASSTPLWPALTQRSDGARNALLVVAASLAGGLLMGVLWWAVTPLAQLEKRPTGVFSVGGDAETSIAADGWFAVIGLVTGVVAALLAGVLLRRHRLGVLLGLAAGGLLGSVVAWRFGVLLGPAGLAESSAAAAVGDRFEAPLELSAVGVLLAWPIAAVIAYFAAVAGVESEGREVAGRDTADAPPVAAESPDARAS